MSRSFYDNPTQKKIVDDIAKRKSDIAVQNSIKAGIAKATANRERQLNILPPPAQFQSAVEESANASYQNQLAIKNLEAFMYTEDARNSFGYLLKHNSINEFNQYSNYFKQSIGERHISYLDFITLWEKFIDQIHNNSFNITKPLLTFETKKLAIEHSRIPKPRSKSESEVTSKPKTKYDANIIEKLDAKTLKDLYKDENLNIPEIPKEKGPAYANVPKFGSVSSKEGKSYIQLIIKQLGERDQLYKYKVEEDKKEGEGLKRMKRIKRMKGGGLNNNDQSLIHTYNILSGEIQAGNDNPSIINQLYSLIDLLKSKNLLKNI